jgi:hypothetical protein
MQRSAQSHDKASHGLLSINWRDLDQLAGNEWSVMSAEVGRSASEMSHQQTCQPRNPTSVPRPDVAKIK